METQFRVATRAPGPGLAALEAELRTAGVPDETVLEMRLVAEEVVINVATYGHGDGGEHWVEVALTSSGQEVTLRFTDDGRPFDPLAATPPDLESPVEERPIGGLGIHLVLTLVDEAEYARRGGRNVLTLRKRVGPGESGVP